MMPVGLLDGSEAVVPDCRTFIDEEPAFHGFANEAKKVIGAADQ